MMEPELKGAQKSWISEKGICKRNNCVHTQKHPSCLQNASHYFCEFCDKTSMHGFNLLVERGRTIPERLYWIIVILVAIYFSTVLVIQAYKNYLGSVVIVSISTSQLGVWDVPFVGFSICPVTKSQRFRFNYTDIYLKKKNKQEVTINETTEFEYMSLLCGGSPELLNTSQITTDDRAIEFLREVAPDLENMIYQVNWLGDEYKEEDLKDLFSPILTSEGVCYTFNNMDRSEIFTDVAQYAEDYFSTTCKPSEWSLEAGFSSDSGIFTSCPRRTLSAGAKGGLSLMLVAYDFDIDYLCGAGSLQGFKVILHHPAEIPRADLGYFLVPLDQVVLAAIRPNMMTTSEDLEHYKAEDRQCYFSTEKNLKFFKIYNQQNCLVECLTNFTLQTCGCVEFHMPRENSTPICSAVRKECIESATASFITNEQTFKKNLKLDTQNNEEKCNCLPSCTSLEFDFEYSQVDWEWREYLKIHSQTRFWNPTLDPDAISKHAHLSHLMLFFKDMQFFTSERNELKGQLELWADFGGLLGLFLGFSFISAFEVLYYLTLRLTCNIRLFGRHYWSGDEELLETKGKRDEYELEVL